MPRTLSQPIDKRDSERPNCAAAGEEQPLDMAELVERCLGSTQLAQRLVTSFRQRMSEALTDLQRTLQSGDAASTAKVAHQLKGSAANVSARPLQRLLARIEDGAKENQIDQPCDCLIELRRELDQLNLYCDSLESNPA